MRVATLIVSGAALFTWFALFMVQATKIYALSAFGGSIVGDLIPVAIPLLGFAATGAIAAAVLRAGGDGRLLWLGGSFVLALFLTLVSQASRAG
jgi:hypothetical protein